MTKTNDERFDALLARAKVPNGQVRRPDLERIANGVGSFDCDDFVEATAKLSSLEWDNGARRPEGYLELHSDDWSIDLSVAANRAAVAWVLLAAALVRHGVTTNSIVWVSRLLPAVCELNEGTAQNGSEVVARLATTELPVHLRRLVHPLDFTDFLQAVRNATNVVVVEGVSLRFDET